MEAQKKSPIQKRKVLVIVGPTASGKSALSVELALTFNGEVISADSRQVYRGLTIGTGKIRRSEMRGIPHHLLDIASPKRTYSAHDFTVHSHRILAKLAVHGTLPIVAGGTGFYIDALFGRIRYSAVSPDKAVRAALSHKTTSTLYALLKTQDPKRAKAMNTPSERNNKIRLIRAIEIAGAPKPPAHPPLPEFDVLWIGVAPPQKTLEQKIAKRLKARIRLGMVAEAKRLHANGLSYKRMESFGLEYRSLARLLQNTITRKEFEEELMRNIRRYAKKQLAYWKRNDAIRWFDPKNRIAIERAVAAWLKPR